MDNDDIIAFLDSLYRLIPLETITESKPDTNWVISDGKDCELNSGY